MVARLLHPACQGGVTGGKQRPPARGGEDRAIRRTNHVRRRAGGEGVLHALSASLLVVASRPLLGPLPVPFEFDGEAPLLPGNPAALLDEGQVIALVRLNTLDGHLPPG